MLGYEKGQIVKSMAGRDKGQFFIVMDIEEDYLLLVDGKNRRIENPKKKKMKHIQITSQVVQEMADKLNTGDKVTNAEFRSCLKAFVEEN